MHEKAQAQNISTIKCEPTKQQKTRTTIDNLIFLPMGPPACMSVCALSRPLGVEDPVKRKSTLHVVFFFGLVRSGMFV